MIRWRILAIASLALCLCGCISKTSGITDASETKWVEGETTRREIVASWGNPDKMTENTWTWKEWRLIGGKVKAAYMMVGVTISNSRASTREYRMTFDDAGKLLRQEVVDSVPGGVSWSVWPW